MDDSPIIEKLRSYREPQAHSLGFGRHG